MRIMAIDYGDARTGIALSDITRTLTGETRVISEKDQDELLRKIADVAQSAGVSRIVVGYPKNMNGTLGQRAEKSEELAKRLGELTGLPVDLWDERLTTVDAHRILAETGHSGKKRKGTVDAVAASLILEGYMSSSAGRA